jgi:hypothetical protein
LASRSDQQQDESHCQPETSQPNDYSTSSSHHQRKAAIMREIKALREKKTFLFIEFLCVGIL